MSERTPKRHALMHVASTAVFLATAVTLLLVPSSAHAQDTPDFRAEFKGQFEASARKFVALSEAMPAETYAWSPMEGVMTVARVYRHVARYNYMYPHLNLGIEPPKGVDYRTLEEGGPTRTRWWTCWPRRWTTCGPLSTACPTPTWPRRWSSTAGRWPAGRSCSSSSPT